MHDTIYSHIHCHILFNYYGNTEWQNNIPLSPKLCTYVTFKNEYEAEPYVKKFLTRKQRSVIAQLRSGTLPLQIETGRFQNIPLEYRLCLLCNSNNVETETHFLFECECYNDLRQQFYGNSENLYPEFALNPDENKLKMMMTTEMIKLTAQFICNCFNKRQSIIFHAT